MTALAPLLAAFVAVAPGQAGSLGSPSIDELSGLTVSRRDPSILWGHNDSGSAPILYRIGIDGQDLGSVGLPDATENDWEDIAAFNDARGPALLVADTGDNFSLGGIVTLYAVRDPGRGDDADPLWRLDFRFPDGAHDCEAVAVDESARQIVMVSKRDTPPRIYTLPLPDHSPREPQVARYAGPLAGLKPGPRRWRQSPSAFSISADGRTAVVLTLGNAYVYRRRRDEPWTAALMRGNPAVLSLPGFAQAEAAALSADGRELFVGSEGSPAPYARIPVPR